MKHPSTVVRDFRSEERVVRRHRAIDEAAWIRGILEDADASAITSRPA
jgi:hypothetical protein